MEILLQRDYCSRQQLRMRNRPSFWNGEHPSCNQHSTKNACTRLSTKQPELVQHQWYEGRGEASSLSGDCSGFWTVFWALLPMMAAMPFQLPYACLVCRPSSTEQSRAAHPPAALPCEKASAPTSGIPYVPWRKLANCLQERRIPASWVSWPYQHLTFWGHPVWFLLKTDQTYSAQKDWLGWVCFQEEILPWSKDRLWIGGVYSLFTFFQWQGVVCLCHKWNIDCNCTW